VARPMTPHGIESLAVVGGTGSVEDTDSGGGPGPVATAGAPETATLG
jgi:hypothetical protein